MKSKSINKYAPIMCNRRLVNQQKRTLRFLINTICLLFIITLLPKNATAQSLGINSSGAIPDSSAMLDIISADKGLLIPRISLISTTDTTTISNPATSLLVYNTNDTITGGSGLGYYYFNGTAWMNFLNGTDNSITAPLITGGSGTTSSLTYKPTTGVGTTGADHVFQVGNNGGTEAMRILNNGNVGIGTSAPLSALQVDNTLLTTSGEKDGVLLNITGAGADASTFPIGQKINLLAGYTGSSFNAGQYIVNATAGTGTSLWGLSHANYGSLVYANGSAAGHNVAVSGVAQNSSVMNVGIHGVATTSSLLNVGVIGQSRTGTAMVGGLFLLGSTIPTLTSSALVADNGNIAAPIFIARDNGTEVFRIDNGGNIGVGTITPASKLDVEGGISIGSNYSGSIAAPSNGAIIEGNVGVGTNSPNGQLTIGMAGYSALKTWNSTDKAGFDFTRVSSPNYTRTFDIYAIGAGSGTGEADIRFINNPPSSPTGVVNLIIKGSGNVGIGTISPSAKLHTLSTTEQLRLGYDASNYYSTTVGSTGAVTFDATGSGAAFTFSDAVTLPTGSIGVTQSLNDSTTKLATTAFVDRAVAGASGGSGWGLTGTSGTVDGTNFIGTTDNIPFTVKVNNQKAGRIDNFYENAFWGYQAGNANTTGAYNTVNGHQALYTNTTGSNNTAIGHKALYSNTTGTLNNAIGDVTLQQNTTGSYNTATGAQALNYNTTGSFNTATGMQTLTVNTTGDQNTATGYNALNSNSTGYQNTGHGFYAGNSNTTGYNNSFFGYNANPSTAALNNATAIGANTYVNATNKVRIGNASVTVIEGQVAFTSVSDGRFKKNINETDVKGLPFIMRLRPVAYNIDTRQFEEFLVKNMPDSVKVKHFKNKDFTASTAIRHNGFVAQEVEVAAQATNYNFGGLHKPENADDNYGLAYAEFVVPLVKAVQEQQQQLNDKDSILTSLQNQIDQLKILVQTKDPK